MINNLRNNDSMNLYLTFLTSYDIVLYCAYTVGSLVTYKIALSRATLLSNYPVRIQMILRDREIIRMKSVHSRFREHMARKIRKHALPGDLACCHGPGIKALNCCDDTVNDVIKPSYTNICILVQKVIIRNINSMSDRMRPRVTSMHYLCCRSFLYVCSFTNDNSPLEYS